MSDEPGDWERDPDDAPTSWVEPKECDAAGLDSSLASAPLESSAADPSPACASEPSSVGGSKPLEVRQARLEEGRGTARQLDPAVVFADRLAGMAFAACVGVASLAGALFLWLALDLGLFWKSLISVLILLQLLGVATYCYRWPAMVFARVTYRVGTLGIEIKRGVIWRHVVTVPLSRIQHTDVSQGPIQRRFGLASLIVHTAGTHQYEVTLAGVTHADALAIRDALVEAEQDGFLGH